MLSVCGSSAGATSRGRLEALHRRVLVHAGHEARALQVPVGVHNVGGDVLHDVPDADVPGWRAGFG